MPTILGCRERRGQIRRPARDAASRYAVPTRDTSARCGIYYGINPGASSALRARRVTSHPRRASARDDRRACRSRGGAARNAGASRSRRVDSLAELDRAVATAARHQGVVARRCDERESVSVEDLCRRRRGAPLIVVLDRIEDPHNVGAILQDGGCGRRRRRRAADRDTRRASAARRRRRRPAPSPHVKIAEVVNIARALEALKDARRLDRRAGGRRSKTLRRDRLHAADGAGGGRRGHRVCGGWSGSVATGWRRFRCEGMSTSSERVGGRPESYLFRSA